MKSEDAVLQFVAAVNGAEVERLASWMTEDHVFVDSDGSRIAGRESVRKAWNQFFSMMPEYRIHVEETYCQENRVVLVGLATGGRAAASVGPWSVPAAWRAEVEGGRVALWQVFVNPEPILAAMRAPGD